MNSNDRTGSEVNSNECSRVLERLQLREPLALMLTSDVELDKQAKNWARIAPRVVGVAERKPRVNLALALVASVCLGLGLLVTNIWFNGRIAESADGATPIASSQTPDPKPLAVAAPQDLRLSLGSEFRRLAVDEPKAAPGEQTTVTFEDGSTITAVAAHTVVEPLAMTGRDVTLRLASGSIDVHVVKGGARKWVIEAGELSVEVVGTRFNVTRTEDRAGVTVTEGIVLVRSAKLPDGLERLVAGESASVLLQQPTVTNHNTPTLEALLQKADRARQAGDLSTAITHLRHILRAFPQDAHSGVVAFQLALVLQQAGAPPQEVVAAFSTALNKAHGQSLRQDCYWRLVLALEHAGQSDQARQRAAQALRAYPNGRYASEFERRLAAPAPAGSTQ